MRLFFISKRHPQQRDLLERPYGRFHHLPRLLAARGHEVEVALCSHRGLPGSTVWSEGVRWIAMDIRTAGLQGFLDGLEHRAHAMAPHWIIGCSDAWYGCLAARLSRRTGSRLAVDAYDNFEAYMPWNLPLHWGWRWAVGRARLVTAAGPQLAERLQSHRRGGAPVTTLPMAADPEFRPLAKDACRTSLGLDLDARYVGYVGSWSASRGSDMLINAFRLARSSRPDLRLLLSGNPPQDVLAEEGVVATGYLPDEAMPTLLNSLDVACIVTAETGFGRYSYPAKLCEAMACRVPVLATATAAVSWMLDANEDHLSPVGDAQEFSRRMLRLLDNPVATYPAATTWESIAAQMEAMLAAGVNP